MFVDREHETISIVRQAEILSISRSSIYYLPVVDGYDCELMRHMVEQYCKKKKIFYVFNENVVCNIPMSKCVKWTEPFVLVSGHIQPCCALNEANQRQYQRDHAFMNCLEGDFRNWWYSDKRKEYLKNLRSGGLPPICKYCHIYYHPEGARSKKG